jgi:hypothetical protein
MNEAVFRDHVRSQDVVGRFIRAWLPAPRQLILDQGKDLNEFYLNIRFFREAT